jgi:hypothetical protein
LSNFPYQTPNATRVEASACLPVLTLPLPCRRKLCKHHGGRIAFYENGEVRFEWKSPHDGRSDANQIDVRTLLGLLASKQPSVLIDMLEGLLEQREVA